MDRLQVGDPSQIGSFRLLGRLGEGGMGRVYLGTSPGGRKVAIKVVHPHYANDPGFRRRLAREVDAARQVGGFHTAAVVAADPGADPPWMATAYIPGPSLAEAVAQRGPLDEAGVRELGAALAEGLAAIHACGLIHRDLKPSNVILADDGPRIIDFGIAKGADATALTGPDVVIGTLRYMSPEQLQGQELTPGSDVFALGIVLAYAATGHDPFEAPTIPAVITRILHDPPSLDPIAGELRDIIDGCLAKQPGSRPGPADLLSRFSPPPSPSGPADGSTPGPAPRVTAPPAAVAPPTSTVAKESPAAPGPPPGSAFTIGSNIAPPPAGPLTSSPATPSGRSRQGGPPAPDSKPLPRGRRRRMALVASGAAAAVVLAVVGVLLLDKQPAGTPKTTLTATLKDLSGAVVTAVAFGPDGTIAAGERDGYTDLWNSTTRQRIATLTDPSSQGVTSVAFGPDGTLATGDGDGRAYLWSTTTRQSTATLADPSSQGITSVAFGPGGILATSDYNGSAYLWNTTTRQIIATLTGPSSQGITSVAFGPGGILATSDYNGGTYLWNTTTRQDTAALPAPAGGGQRVSSVAFGPDGTLATGDNNTANHGTTYLWDTTTRHITATLTDPSSQGVTSVAFGPDGTLATGDYNGSTYLWNTTTRRIIATLTGPSSQSITSVAFEPDGTLATGDYNGSTYLW